MNKEEREQTMPKLNQDAVSLLTRDVINRLVEECHECAVKHGFWDHKGSDVLNTVEKVALIHSEVSELLEELRKTEMNKDAVAEELADICIRVFDLVGYFSSIDLGVALLSKMSKNKARPYKHGKRF